MGDESPENGVTPEMVEAALVVLRQDNLAWEFVDREMIRRMLEAAFGVSRAAKSV
jgi:hypothetical protein